jgi:hypothetical protein
MGKTKKNFPPLLFRCCCWIRDKHLGSATLMMNRYRIQYCINTVDRKLKNKQKEFREKPQNLKKRFLEGVTERNQRRHFVPVNFSYYRPAGDALLGRQEAGIGLDTARHLCHLPGMAFHQLSYPFPPAVNILWVE